jgi:hypothetical protein
MQGSISQEGIECVEAYTKGILSNRGYICSSSLKAKKKKIQQLQNSCFPSTACSTEEQARQLAAI